MSNDKITPNYCALKVGLWKKHRFETTSTRPSTTAEKHHHRERCIAKTRANAGESDTRRPATQRPKRLEQSFLSFFVFFRGCKSLCNGPLLKASLSLCDVVVTHRLCVSSLSLRLKTGRKRTAIGKVPRGRRETLEKDTLVGEHVVLRRSRGDVLLPQLGVAQALPQTF